MTPPLTRGEVVVITTPKPAERCKRSICMASPDGRALVLQFDAMIGGWLRQLVAFRDDHGRLGRAGRDGAEPATSSVRGLSIDDLPALRAHVVITGTT